MRIRSCFALLGMFTVGWIGAASAATINVSGNITTNAVWNDTNSQYRVTGALTVNAGVTLTVGAGVEVTQAGGCSVTVNGAVVLLGNAQWDTDSTGANITVNGRWTSQAGSRLQVGAAAVLTVNTNGVMTMSGGQWLRLGNDGRWSSGIAVYGSLAMTNTPVEPTPSSSYIEVYSGGRFVASGCNLQLSALEFQSGSSGWVNGGNDGTATINVYGTNVWVAGLLSAGPVTLGGPGQALSNSVITGLTVGSVTPVVRGNAIRGSNPLYCRAEYLNYLRANNTFNVPTGSVVHITGGTLNGDSTWGVLGGIGQYRIEGHLSVASNATLTVGSGAVVTQGGGCYVTVNGAVVLLTNAQWDTDGVGGCITVNGGWTSLAASRLLLGGGGVLTVNTNGVMTMSGGQWLRLGNDGRWSSGIAVYGSLAMTNTPVEPTPSSSYIEVYSGGRFVASGCNLQLSALEFQSGSAGTVAFCQIANLSIYSDSTASIHNNDFTSTTVSASGNSSATINLTRNWWGTTDPAAIEARITDHVDNASLPTVVFGPVLPVSPMIFSGFYVIARWPESNTNQLSDHLDIAFNNFANPSEFTAADMSLWGQSRLWPVQTISNVYDTTYRLTFGALPAGDYVLFLGPNILDVNGRAMDQNTNGVAGETNDFYTTTFVFDRTPPRVNGHTPAGDLAGTVSSLDIMFSEAMVAGTFTVADVQITRPDAGTATATAVTALSSSRYRITFPAQTAIGRYRVRVGPQITDLAGNPMDQDDNGTPGQTNDAYVATFNLVDVDLLVTNLTVMAPQLWAGDAVRVSWVGKNSTGYQLLGDWTDAVYLSSDATWDIGDILLTSLHHTNGLATGRSYTNSVDVIVPGVLPGNYRIIVRADIYNQERELNRRGNNVAVSGPLPVNVHPLGSSVSGTQSANDRYDYYVFQLAPRQNLRLALDSAATSGANEVYVGYGRIPTRQDFDFRVVPGAPDAQLTIPATYDGGTYYVMVYADQLSGTPTYQFSGQAYGILVNSVTPDHYGRQVPGTLTVTGDGFDDTTGVELVSTNGSVVLPTAVNIVSANQLTADWDFPSVDAGVYSVRVTKGSGPSNELANAFTVLPGLGPRLQASLAVPSAVRGGSWIAGWIEYANAGDAPMPAPLFMVSANGGAYLSLEESVWHSTGGATDKVQVWAKGSSGTPGTLQPGDSGMIPFYGVAQGGISWTLGSLGATATDPIDWVAMRTNAQPAWMAPDAWEATWTAFTAQVGSTWGDFVKMRCRVLDYLQGIGQNAADLSLGNVLAFAVVLSSQSGASPIMASAVDLRAPTPGVPLVFSRVFSQTPEARYRVGPLGRGWSHNWDFSAQVLTNGDVAIRGPGSVNRFFVRDAATGAYNGFGGDAATLTLSNAVYRLVEKDGTIYQFRSDRLLDWVADRNANRVICGYSGGALTSLAHSCGSRLLITYNAYGRISQVANTNGPGPADDRAVSYGYDATGKYLNTAVLPGNRTSTYAYQTTGSAGALHSLRSITYACCQNTYFYYDQYGRLTGKEGDNNANRVVFTYPSLGVVTAQDAGGVRTVIRYGSSGQPVRMETPGSVVRSQFNEDNKVSQLAGPEGQLSRFSYDANGNLASMIDPSRGTTQFAYDPTFNQITNLVDARGNGMQYKYDANGNLARITYQDASFESFGYDARGNLNSWTNRRGQAITFTYNAAGQVLTKDYLGTPGIDYIYRYDSWGNLTNMVDSTGSTSFTYDPNTDWLTRIDYPGGKWFQFAYDAAGRRTNRLDQTGTSENYAYDGLRRLARMTDGAGQLIVDYQYDTAGRLFRKTLGNGVFTTFSYNTAGQLTNLANSQSNGTVISRFAYTYDASGHRTSMTTLDGAWGYGYDANGQLTTVTYPDAHTVEYQYDDVGNRTNLIDNGVATAYTVNTMNQYTQVGAASYLFDRDGNLTNKTRGLSPPVTHTMPKTGWSASPRRAIRGCTSIMQWEIA